MFLYSKGNTPFEDALEDAFLILQSPLLKVGRKNGNNDSASAEDEDDLDLEGSQDASKGKAAATAAMQKAKTRVLKKLSLQHLVSHILPVVTSLKHSLEACKSPLQVQCLCLLYKRIHTCVFDAEIFVEYFLVTSLISII